VKDGHEFLVCQSYSKNFGLYGERVGAVSAVCRDPEEADRVASQMKLIVRPMYSNPPIYGARIVNTILSDKKLYAQWEVDCKTMADRIADMRTLLKNTLVSHGSKRSWNHITDQIGMFCYTGLTKEEVIAIRDKHAVYMTMDGRVSMAGVNSSNVDYLAESMHHVTK
jgi:aspartate aminotransferase, mitochondrial